MKKLVIAVTMASSALTALPVQAQNPEREYRRDVREAQQDYRRAKKEQWRDYRRYDYNRADPRYGNYYADRYYRDGRYYQPRRLSYSDRIYRGSNGQYYCRRPDGTTGLIIGGAIGALLGNSIDRGRSSTVGTIIGAGAGAVLGRSVERGQVTCR